MCNCAEMSASAACILNIRVTTFKRIEKLLKNMLCSQPTAHSTTVHLQSPVTPLTSWPPVTSDSPHQLVTSAPAPHARNLNGLNAIIGTLPGQFPVFDEQRQAPDSHIHIQQGRLATGQLPTSSRASPEAPSVPQLVQPCSEH